MRLSQRLAALLQLVPYNCILADIGCDHAYLPCAFVLSGKGKRAYACDINPNPLKNAQKTIDECGLNGIVVPVLSDGLKECPKDCNVVAISGMGFETIKSILEADLEFVKQCQCLLIQSNSDVDLLRLWCSIHEFRILDERIVHEGHYYHILKIAYEKGAFLSDDEIYFGVGERNALFYEYWNFRADKMREILNQLDAESELAQQFNQRLKRIDVYLKNSR